MNASECRVLVVDDNEDSTDNLAVMMDLAGFQVQVAYDGNAALSRMVRSEPHVGFIEIGLSDLTGHQLARAARSAGREILLVAISGYGAHHDLMEASDAGFDYHFTKPAKPEQLIALVRSHCKIPDPLFNLMDRYHRFTNR